MKDGTMFVLAFCFAENLEGDELGCEEEKDLLYDIEDDGWKKADDIIKEHVHKPFVTPEEIIFFAK